MHGRFTAQHPSATQRVASSDSCLLLTLLIAPRTMKLVFCLLLAVTAVLAEPPAPQYLPPNGNYGPPNGGGNGGGRPGPEYGAPRPGGPAPGPSYGPPNGGSNGGGYDDNDEPASYQFEYKVEDQEAGLDFGHEEQREGDVARGKYYVLLPDGRKQTVEYTADSDGYHPMVSYEGEANGGNGGYPRGPQNGGNGGYPRGPQNGGGRPGGNGGYNY